MHQDNRIIGEAMYKALKRSLALFAVICLMVSLAPKPALSVSTLNYELLGTHAQAAAQTTVTGKTIKDLEVFNDKLYAGYGDWGANTGPISVTPYNLSTNVFEASQLTVPTEAIDKLRLINSKLYAPMIDPTCSSTCPAGYAEGETWQNKAPVNAMHVLDMASLDGTDLWMVGSSDSSVSGAHAFRSTDGGSSWQIVQTDTSSPKTTNFERYYWVANMQGKIYMQAQHVTNGAPVRIFDGNDWSTGTTSPITDGTKVEVFKGKIVATPAYGTGLSIFDGVDVNKATSLFGDVTDIYVDGDYLYILRTDGSLTRTSDLQGWQELGMANSQARSIAVKNGVVYYATNTAQLYRSTTTLPAYVADAVDFRAMPAPVFKNQFGQYGSNRLYPLAVAIDGEGNVYTSDSEEKVVVKYDHQTKQPIAHIGGAEGSGKLSSPGSLTIDANGNIYVMDFEARNIKKYQADGTHLLTFGESGSAEGQINYDGEGYPAITSDATGNILVADGNNHVQKFNSNGQFISAFGSEGSADGQMYSPVGLAVDEAGSIYVAEAGNNRIQKFTSDGVFVGKFGSEGTEPGQFSYLWGLSTDGQNLYTADLIQSKVQKFSNNGELITSYGTEGTGDGQLQSVYAVAARDNALQVIDQTGRIQQFAIDTTQYQSKITGETFVDGKFNQPYDIVVDATGNSLVVDRANNRIQKFDSNGNFLSYFGASGTENGKFVYPHGISLDGSGNIYVSDSGTDGLGRVQKFNASGDFMAELPIPADVGPLVVDGNGNIYILHRANGTEVRKYSSTGTLLQSWGSTGNSESQWNEPQDFVLDQIGNFYILDTGHNRVQKFDANGDFLQSWGGSGVVAGRFRQPKGIAIDENQNIYVGDSDNSRIQMFSANGDFKTQWGATGTDEGQFNNPVAIAVASNNDIRVVDQNNNRIQQFAYNNYVSLDYDKLRIQTPIGSNIDCATKVLERNLTKRDKLYRYPHGIANFCVNVAPGSTHQFTVTFSSGKSKAKLTPRMFDPSTRTYTTITDAIIKRDNSDGTKRKAINYTATDGGEWDSDHTVNGVINNYVGLGVVQESTTPQP